MTRCRTWTAILALLIVATALPLVATPQDAAASTLRARLTNARHSLATARNRLTTARAALAAAIAAAETATTPTTATPTPDPTLDATTPQPAATDAAPDVMPTDTGTPEPAATVATTAVAVPTVEELQTRVAHWRQVVRQARHRVERLARAYRLQQQLAAWERTGQWRPIIRVAAAKYHVSADTMYRLMMRESCGRRYAGSTFKGLFQYHPGTWTASWNPWRHDSIYDGSSQIFATAYAVHRGWGPRMWPNTY